MSFHKIVCSHLLSQFIIGFLLVSITFCALGMSPPQKDKNIFPPHSLIGTLISEDSPSIAILKEESSKKTVWLEEGEIIYGYELTQVFKDRIVLQREEETFQIFLGGSGVTNIKRYIKENPDKINSSESQKDFSSSNEFNEYSIIKEFSRSEIEKRMITEWRMIMKTTSFSIYYANGKASGLRIIKLPESSILSETGIQENDIIKEVNGIEVKEIKNLAELFNKLKDKNQFIVNIERNRETLRLLYILK